MLNTISAECFKTINSVVLIDCSFNKDIVNNEDKLFKAEDQNFLETLLDILKLFKYLSLIDEKREQLNEYLKEFEEKLNEKSLQQKKIYNCQLYSYIKNLDNEAVTFKIYLCSCFAKVFYDENYYKEIWKEMQKENYRVYNYLFVWYQFNRSGLAGLPLSFDYSDLYKKVFAHFLTKIKPELLEPISFSKRNKNNVLVITLQFLDIGHAPTRTALERIYTLGKKLNKNVFVINSCEQYSELGEIPFYKGIYGSINEKLWKETRLQYKDYVFDFYQPNTVMPDIEEISNIIELIRMWKPYQIIVIGKGCILGDLCAKIIPTVCIPVTFSTVPYCPSQYVSVGKKLKEEEKEELIANGYPVHRIIEDLFTFELREQTHHYTREEFHLPKDKFLLLVIGLRLDADVKDEFIEAMLETFQWRTHLVFVGLFNTYEEMCKKYKSLEKHSSYLGLQDDILAITELGDLYVNPMRVGGGFSIIETFYHGKPGVTLSYGDVAAAAGNEFCVNNYQEMIEKIHQYIFDKDFYCYMGKRAKERYIKMTDSVPPMEHILKEMEEKEYFF